MNASAILNNANVLIVGLGSHGGGVSVTKYCVQQAARVTVYDKQTAETLSSSIGQLAQHHHAITYSLGHQDYYRLGDYDVVIKNPATPRTHPLLSHAPICLTDITLFFAETTQKIVAVTGTKGKSTTVSAIAYGFQVLHIPHVLVGNIGVPALDKVSSLEQSDIIIIEMSSFQLGDYAYCTQKLRSLIENVPTANGGAQPHSTPLTQIQQRIAQYYYHKLLSKHWPDVAVITNILPDHLDYYGSMDDYVADKMVIFERQTDTQYKFINAHSSQQQYANRFVAHGNATPILYSSIMQPINSVDAPHNSTATLRFHDATNTAYLTIDHRTHSFDCNTPLNISHVNAQVAIAQSVLQLCTTTEQDNHVSYDKWHGIPYRLEIIATHRGITIINDSAATIPLATLQNISQLSQPIFLICGGSDKKVDLSPFIDIANIAEEIFLLSGSATDSIVSILTNNNISFHGPFHSMEHATDAAWECINTSRNKRHAQSPSQSFDNTDSAQLSQQYANTPQYEVSARDRQGQPQPSPTQILILSPGCASFGMFRNEFDRGDQFVKCMRHLISAST